MFLVVCRSSSGALTAFAASGLHTHAVTARSQAWVGTAFPLRLDHGRSPHAYVNQRLQIQLGLLMMSDIPLETCWAFNKLRNIKFRYQVASCWLLLLKKRWVLVKSESDWWLIVRWSCCPEAHSVVCVCVVCACVCVCVCACACALFWAAPSDKLVHWPAKPPANPTLYWPISWSTQFNAESY